MCNECKIDYSLSIITTALNSDQIKILFYTYANQSLYILHFVLCTFMTNQKTDKQIKVVGSPKTAPRVHEFCAPIHIYMTLTLDLYHIDL